MTPNSRSDWIIVCFALRTKTFPKVEMLRTGDPKLNCESLGFIRNPPEHSFIHAYATLCNSLNGKPLENYHEVRPIVPLRKPLQKHLPGRILALQSYFRLPRTLNLIANSLDSQEIYRNTTVYSRLFDLLYTPLYKATTK